MHMVKIEDLSGTKESITLGNNANSFTLSKELIGLQRISKSEYKMVHLLDFSVFRTTIMSK